MHRIRYLFSPHHSIYSQFTHHFLLCLLFAVGNTLLAWGRLIKSNIVKYNFSKKQKKSLSELNYPIYFTKGKQGETISFTTLITS